MNDSDRVKRLESTLKKHFDDETIFVGIVHYHDFAHFKEWTDYLYVYARRAIIVGDKQGSIDFTEIVREVSRFYPQNWTAENWQEFEDLCKQNL